MIHHVLHGLVLGWLWRQGGKTDTVWRRIVAPVYIFVITQSLMVSILVAVCTRLPITLIGDDLKKHWQMVWWVPVLCALHAVPVLITSGLYHALFILTAQVLMIIGSNTVNFPKWGWYEKLYGFLLGVCLS